MIHALHLLHFFSITPPSKPQTLFERLFIVASSNLTSWTPPLSRYLDAVAASLPDSVKILINTHVTPLLKLSAAQQQPSTTDRINLLLTDYASISYTTVAATLLAFIYFLYSMSSYGRSALDNWGGRRSPYSSAAGARSVTDNDFQYLGGPEDLDAPRPYTYDHRPSVARSHGYDDGEGPDIILLRHMNTQYELKFKPFAISDGILRVGDIRNFAADTLRAPDPARLRLLYKGRQLKDDRRPAKEYGLKQQSEIMVVVSETPPSRPNSDSETEDSGSAVSHASKRVRDRSRKPKPKTSKENLGPPLPEKGRRSRRGSRAPSPHPLPRSRSPAPPSPPQSPPIQPPKADSPRGKVQQLTSIFHTQWVPKCIQFLLSPPSDRKMRDQEHKRLSESILAQILLKADDIELEGDGQARAERKALVVEINEMFKKLDAAAKGQ
jgi:BAG domain/Ubiquitin family